MKLIIQKNYDLMCEWAANHIIDAINSHKEERPFVLGLPTGSSPLSVYKRFIIANKAGKVSFKNVVTFNMDEYVSLPRSMTKATGTSCTRTSSNTSTSAENINILDGMAADLEEECTSYEENRILWRHRPVPRRLRR